MLDKDMIEDATRWRLTLRIGKFGLDVLAIYPYNPEAMIYRTLPLDPTAPSRLKALEDVVYDNPLLLSDFSRVSCLVDTSRYILVPSDDVSSREECHELLGKIFPDEESVAVASSVLPWLHMKVHNEVNGFLRRTFFNAALSHPLAPLIGYFMTRCADDAATDEKAQERKMTYVCFREGAMDVVVAQSGRLLLANSFRYEEAADIVYYLLAVRDAFELDAERDPVMTVGYCSLKDEAMEVLRKYVREVLPLPLSGLEQEIVSRFPQMPFDMAALQGLLP